MYSYHNYLFDLWLIIPILIIAGIIIAIWGIRRNKKAEK